MLVSESALQVYPREQVGFCRQGRIFLPARDKNYLLAGGTGASYCDDFLCTSLKICPKTRAIIILLRVIHRLGFSTRSREAKYAWIAA